MKVLKEENEIGELKYLTFQADDEDLGELKSAIKDWISANFPSVTWEAFFDRLERLEGTKMKVRMT